jgi:steroid Delta-isomerase
MKTPLELAETSLALTKAGGRDGWLALFEDDAVVQDPVGPSPTVEYTIERSYSGGDEVAVVINFQISGAGGEVDMDVVNIYPRSSNGKLASLRSFWDGSRQGQA